MAVEFLLLLVSLLGILIYWCHRNYSYWQRLGVPYIKPIPIIGNLQVLFTMKTSFALYLNNDVYFETAMVNKPLVGIYLLNKPALVVRDLNLIKTILIKDFAKFSNHYSSCDPNHDPLGAYNLFFSKNPEWKEIRIKLSPVFTSGKVKQMYPLMLQISSELESHLAVATSKHKTFVADVKDICASFTTDLIATIAFGVHANSLQNPQAEFRKMSRIVFDFSFLRSINFFIAFFLPSLTTTFRTTVFPKEFSDFVRKTINYIMNERERTGHMRNDLIDILMALKKEAAQLNNGEKHFAQNVDFLLAQAAAFLSAGFETSSSTMTFAFYELSKHADVQQCLRLEILKALLASNGQLSYEQIHSLEYLDMVVSEVLRLYPVLPFLDRVHSLSKNDNKFSLQPYYDVQLPEGMPIFVPIFAIQRDPQYWPNPQKFDPERFTAENKKLHEPMTYMPFGTGPRNCIGSRIGSLNVKLGLVHILKNHYVSACGKTVDEMDFDPKAYLLASKSGIYLNVTNDGMYDEAIKTEKNSS